MYLLGVLSPDKSQFIIISPLIKESKLTSSSSLLPASELTTARSRLQTYSSLPKSNDLVSRLATSAARKYHLRTFGTRSIEQMVQDATVDPPPLPPSFRPDILAGIGGPGDISRNGSAQASPLLGGERSFPTSLNSNSILPPPSSPTLFPISSTPPALLQDDEPSPTPSIEPSSPSFPPPLPPLPSHPPQPQRVFSQFSTNLTNSSASPSIFPSPSPTTAPPPIHTFTRSIVDVLGSWANQHPGCLDRLDWERRDIIDGWVSTVGPFVGCLKLEAGVYWGWGEWRGKMGELIYFLGFAFFSFSRRDEGGEAALNPRGAHASFLPSFPLVSLFSDTYFAENPLPNRLASFMSLFRSTLPELYVRLSLFPFLTRRVLTTLSLFSSPTGLL